tara:strand:- start:1210 stop:1446 length:237 start_codon:yes stop_codon:yes gene_type:complete
MHRLQIVQRFEPSKINRNSGALKMTKEQAWKIIGNQPKWAIKNMIKALSLHPWKNTNEDKLRIEAGKICLKTKNPRYE